MALRGTAVVRGRGGWPRCVLGVSWRSWQAVTAMRRPGREGIQGRGRRFGRKSDLRRRLVREMPHLGPIGDEDVGNVTLPCALSRFSRPRSGPGDALRTLTTPGGGQSTQRRRHCWTTREEACTSHGLCDEVSLPSRSSDPSVPLPARSLLTPHIPGRLGHGHSLPGPWTRRPFPFPGASPTRPRPLPRAPARRGSHPSRPRPRSSFSSWVPITRATVAFLPSSACADC